MLAIAAAHVAYWDVAAALCTVGDMTFTFQ